MRFQPIQMGTWPDKFGQQIWQEYTFLCIFHLWDTLGGYKQYRFLLVKWLNFRAGFDRRVRELGAESSEAMPSALSWNGQQRQGCYEDLDGPRMS